MVLWAVKVLTPFWVAMYIILLRGVSGLIFVPLVLYLGIWGAALVAILIYGIWGTIFYLLLLQAKSFDKVNEYIIRLLEKKDWKIFVWLRKKLENRNGLQISSGWIALVFVIESPLTGLPLIRMKYPRKIWWLGIIWVWIGALIEVTTWFVPLYGGGMEIFKMIVAFVT